MLAFPKRPKRWNMSDVFQPQTREIKKTSINHPTSVFELFGVHCSVSGTIPRLSLKKSGAVPHVPQDRVVPGGSSPTSAASMAVTGESLSG